jgi:hypothetical protein
MTIEILAAFVGVFAALQALSMFLTNLGTVSKQIEGRATWTAPDGTLFEEFSVNELEQSAIMKQDFEVSRTEAILASHFAGVEAKAEAKA